MTGYDRFVGILVDQKVTESADWSQWIRYALDGTASIPQPFDECAVAFQQFRPEATADWQAMRGARMGVEWRSSAPLDVR